MKIPAWKFRPVLHVHAIAGIAFGDVPVSIRDSIPLADTRAGIVAYGTAVRIRADLQQDSALHMIPVEVAADVQRLQHEFTRLRTLGRATESVIGIGCW